MKQRSTLLSLVLVLTLLFGVLTLSSCDKIGGLFGKDDQGDQGGSTQKPDEKPDEPGNNPGGGTGDPDPSDPTDVPTLSELDAKFYDAANWAYMTNDNGASLDGGNIPYTMADGSIKFHNANQGIEMGDFSNATVSFMLKATNDFSLTPLLSITPTTPATVSIMHTVSSELLFPPLPTRQRL